MTEQLLINRVHPGSVNKLYLYSNVFGL